MGDRPRRPHDLGRPRLLLAPGRRAARRLRRRARPPRLDRRLPRDRARRPRLVPGQPPRPRPDRPQARGQGLGALLVSLAVERGFGELALTEISLGVWAHNTAALHIYEKLGFRTERVIEDVEEVDGALWSAHQMTLRSPRG
ncbi:GNAT family N-acetyltransferase [Streptomyces xanthophaeus]